MQARRIVVIGGGFGGLNVAKGLASQKDVNVQLIDQRNHHLFQPLLYQVATAGLNPADIAAPIRSQFSEASNVEVHWEEVRDVDLNARFVRFASGGTLNFDELILACGAQHSYFGHPEWEEFAPGLKTLEQAIEIRRRILSAFEHAENTEDAARRAAYLTFVVVGAGPTGVELAGAIADISRTVLINDFRRIDPGKARVLLVEAAPRVLTPFAEDLSARSLRDLESMGVEVRLNSKVDRIQKDGVQIGAEFIPAMSVFWAAGVQATRLNFAPSLKTDRAGRVEVTANLQVPGFPHVHVIGDMAAVPLPQGGIVPGVAPAAIQEGKYVADGILARLRGKAIGPFVYRDKGQMATIGKFRAIVQSGKFKMTGYPAWVVWLFIHIFYLIGFKNRVAVLSQWAWNYVFSKRGSRLITDADWRLKP